MKKENLELRRKIWNLYCNDTDVTRIAERLRMPQQTVSWHIKKIKASNEYQANTRAIEQFQDCRDRVIHSVEEEVADITKELESEDNPRTRIELRQLRHQLRIDLYRLQGDGEMVFALRKTMKDATRDIPA